MFDFEDYRNQGRELLGADLWGSYVLDDREVSFSGWCDSFDGVEDMDFSNPMEEPFSPAHEAMERLLGFEIASAVSYYVEHTYERTGVLLPLLTVESYQKIAHYLVTYFSKGDSEGVLYLSKVGYMGKNFYRMLADFFGGHGPSVDYSVDRASRYSADNRLYFPAEVPADSVTLEMVKRVVLDCLREQATLAGLDGCIFSVQPESAYKKKGKTL